MRIDAEILSSEGDVIGSGIVLDDGIVTDILPPASECASAWFFPGFVDIHCHGGGGASFSDDIDEESIERAVATHRGAGTVHLIGSLVSLLEPLPAIEAIAAACDRGSLAGIHLEGPFISPARAGAQNPAAIRPIDLGELQKWLDAGRGWIRTVTIAPELDGAMDAAELLADYGALPSWGHTNATADEVRPVISAVAAWSQGQPAQIATHLFNAMPPLLHRAPGPVRELLASARRSEMIVELIGDGLHVHPDLVADILIHLDDVAGVALVSDAMAGAGMPDGQYELGGLDVSITSSVARLAGTHTLAGGTSTLARQVALLLGHGVPAPVLARAACRTPSAVIGIEPPPSPAIGQPLTGVLMDAAGFRVWRDGAPVGND